VIKSRAKTRLTVHLPEDLVERTKNAVVWTPGLLTLSQFAQQAFEERLEDLERLHKGRPFPRRNRELRGGRTPKLSLVRG
jgi:hypothetical protein